MHDQLFSEMADKVYQHFSRDSKLLLNCNAGLLLRKRYSQAFLWLVHILLPPVYVVRREGNSFTLLVCPQGGVSQLMGGLGPAGGVRSSRGGSGPAGGVQVQLGRGVRSSRGGGGQVQLGGGGVSQLGGSASCALLRAVCLLRSL